VVFQELDLLETLGRWVFIVSDINFLPVLLNINSSRDRIRNPNQPANQPTKPNLT